MHTSRMGTTVTQRGKHEIPHCSGICRCFNGLRVRSVFFAARQRKDQPYGVCTDRARGLVGGAVGVHMGELAFRLDPTHAILTQAPELAVRIELLLVVWV